LPHEAVVDDEALLNNKEGKTVSYYQPLPMFLPNPPRFVCGRYGYRFWPLISSTTLL